MKETFGYIDDYFQRKLSDIERKNFEERCIQDEAFANEVAFYISSRQALRETLLDEKKKDWAQHLHKIQQPAQVRKLRLGRWLPYAAAACIVLAVILWPLMSQDGPTSFADKYIKTELVSISQTMDASQDSIQSGIEAYNRKDYNTAEQYFRNIYKSHPENTDAIRYLGQTFLMNKNYGEALVSFRELAAKKGLYSNPGLFLQAVTLLKRNGEGDAEVARMLLNQVINENLDGSREARQWLENWQ